jgi:hypothetical protein
MPAKHLPHAAPATALPPQTVTPECCGGPSKSDASACCALDEQRKGDGQAGCGCGRPPGPPPSADTDPGPATAERRGARGCCGAEAA